MASFEQAIKFGADMINWTSMAARTASSSDPRPFDGSNSQGQSTGARSRTSHLRSSRCWMWACGRALVCRARILTLDEVRGLQRRATFLIELKARGVEKKVAQVIREAGMEDSVMLQSFDAESVRIMRTLLPETPAGVLYRDTWILDPAGRGRRILEQTLEVGASFAGMNVGAVSAELVRVLKGGGIDVFAWTADDDWVFAHLIQAGVDGIITNYPDRLLRHLGREVGE